MTMFINVIMHLLQTTVVCLPQHGYQHGYHFGCLKTNWHSPVKTTVQITRIHYTPWLAIVSSAHVDNEHKTSDTTQYISLGPVIRLVGASFPGKKDSPITCINDTPGLAIVSSAHGDNEHNTSDTTHVESCYLWQEHLFGGCHKRNLHR